MDQIIKFDQDLLENEIVQICCVVPNWKKAILPWMQLGKKFSKLTLSKETLSEYFVQGIKREVDFIAEVVLTPFPPKGDTFEFITPIQGESMYSQFLQKQAQGGLQHFAMNLKNSESMDTLKERFKQIGVTEICRFTVAKSIIAYYYQFPTCVCEFWTSIQDGPGVESFYKHITWADMENLEQI